MAVKINTQILQASHGVLVALRGRDGSNKLTAARIAVKWVQSQKEPMSFKIFRLSCHTNAQVGRKKY